MSDSDLRNLEREAATGDVEGGARLLLEQVRSGALDANRLELASYLGHEAARLASPREEPDQGLGPWATKLAAWGVETLSRGAIAAARLVLPVYQAQYPTDDRVVKLLSAAERQLADPSPANLLRCQRLDQDIVDQGFDRARYAYSALSAARAVTAERVDALLASDLDWEVAVRLVQELQEAGADVYLNPGHRGPPQSLLQRGRPKHTIAAIKSLRSHTGLDLHSAHDAIQAGGSAVSFAVAAARTAADTFWAEEGLTPERVRAAIQSELIPWALGLGDPIRERVVKRSGPEVLP